ncbi:tRNA 4-thiouridine(8) synthase ThiI ['Elaeagnus angustifolia' witches'-broom phytoplasma]|uniref:Probable tRNA sulfurtransferase n=1 Tax='Elaeagnus angustifolia' witches'-broom phytoplasma TaxID=1538355 RepID=A0ABS5VAE2_9MOLU|nr:tRNA 4-thiouridine(8) synthase ThiI ['Elaeagnus angustifolia' witches'-broom phytoplasma]
MRNFMYQKKILIRFGELFLKGKNKKAFINILRQLLQNKIKDLCNVQMYFKHDYAYLEYIYDASLEKEILKRLSYVSGISSFVVVSQASRQSDDIVQKACLLLQEKITKNTSFKIETTRKDKSFALKSLELTQQIAPLILKQFEGKLIVDVKNPQVILHVSIRKENTYLYLKSDETQALGGFPVSSGGRGTVLMSGGIDSPVAAYLAMKKGITVELLHFESSPLTPLESIQKVIDLSKVLSRYAFGNQIKLHLVPFRYLQETITKTVLDSYIINVMRRMMYRLASQFAFQKNHLCLINGESVGQVASQTLESMQTTTQVTSMIILRPLVTMDKNEIIKIAKQINTFDISIRAFHDCCTLYLPQNPTTKPTILKAKREEQKIDYFPLLNDALQNTITLNIDQHLQFNICDYGFFDVKEAIKHFCEQNPEQTIVSQY